jgi:hypothetical protein
MITDSFGSHSLGIEMTVTREASGPPGTDGGAYGVNYPSARRSRNRVWATPGDQSQGAQEIILNMRME